MLPQITKNPPEGGFFDLIVISISYALEVMRDNCLQLQIIF